MSVASSVTPPTMVRKGADSSFSAHKVRLSVEEAYAILEEWDMSAVRTYLMNHDGISEQKALNMEREYKRFIALSLLVESGLNVPISAGVDPFWHTHIIFTHDYTAMCLALGGHYIHHVPAVSDEERARLCSAYGSNTLALYRSYFGEPDPEFWPENAQICIVCCDRDRTPDHGKVLVI